MEKQYLEDLSKTLTKVLNDDEELKEKILNPFLEACEKAKAEKQ